MNFNEEESEQETLPDICQRHIEFPFFLLVDLFSIRGSELGVFPVYRGEAERESAVQAA